MPLPTYISPKPKPPEPPPGNGTAGPESFFTLNQNQTSIPEIPQPTPPTLLQIRRWLAALLTGILVVIRIPVVTPPLIEVVAEIRSRFVLLHRIVVVDEGEMPEGANLCSCTESPSTTREKCLRRRRQRGRNACNESPSTTREKCLREQFVLLQRIVVVDEGEMPEGAICAPAPNRRRRRPRGRNA